MTQPTVPGRIFIVSAASGTGKTTLVSRLLNTGQHLRLSVSHTTRPPRAGEEHGRHYYFVSVPQFEQALAEGAFLEHAQVYGHYYGTSVAGVTQLQQQGFDVILEIDIQGAEQVRRLLPDATSIFILPPSLQVLAERLNQRGTDTAEVIATRMSNARHEIEQAYLFDYLVVNDDVVRATQDLIHIIHAQRLRQQAQAPFLTGLLGAQ